jgi:glutamine synthetase
VNVDPAPFKEWLGQNRVSEVEAIVADMSGVARGKILPTARFLDGLERGTLRMPESVFAQTVTGDFVASRILDPVEPDISLAPDFATLRIVPWYEEPTAQVICDAATSHGELIAVAPRAVLIRILDFYRQRGWKPVVAPEIELYLARPNIDPDYPLEPPAGASGRPETGRQSYGIDAVNEFDPLFEDVYDYAEAQQLAVDTLTHEAGMAQVEINFRHGAPLDLADQMFYFKRTVRQAGLRHNIHATFMAKPHESEPGSSMHIHQSVVSADDGTNLFANADGSDSELFLFHIGGLQKHLASAMPLIAPNVNSYRRIQEGDSSPVNTHWGRENRTAGFRVPRSDPEARRVENRVPGADSNPYLAIAASLACGYIGMIDQIEPRPPVEGSAYSARGFALPRHLLDALERFRRAERLHEFLGEDFSAVYLEVKRAEHDAYTKVISAWEREHLLLNV